MKTLKQNWKAIVALILVIAAVCVYFLSYRPAVEEFERKEKELNTMIQRPTIIREINRSALRCFKNFRQNLFRSVLFF